MAYLTKEQYAYRAEAAAKRNVLNEEITVENGMTEEQAELISELCSLRHKLHCNMRSIAFNYENGDLLHDIVVCNHKLYNCGSEYMDFVPTSDDDFIDIDNIDLLYEIGEDVPDDEDEYREWVDDQASRIIGELSELNDKIEGYLAGIDKKYNTHFAPTGALRLC